MIERGRFRKDLYYRLRGVTIHLPPLREHREDIAELAHDFLFRFNRQLGTAVQSISPQRWSYWRSTSGRETCGSCRASCGRR